MKTTLHQPYDFTIRVQEPADKHRGLDALVDYLLAAPEDSALFWVRPSPHSTDKRKMPLIISHEFAGPTWGQTWELVLGLPATMTVERRYEQAKASLERDGWLVR